MQHLLRPGLSNSYSYLWDYRPNAANFSKLVPFLWRVSLTVFVRRQTYDSMLIQVPLKSFCILKDILNRQWLQ